MKQRFTQKRLFLVISSFLLVNLLSIHTTHAQQSLFSDIRAFRIGDAVTITLAERTAAQRESGWERKTNSGTSGGASLDGGPNLSGSFGVNATFNNETSNQNESIQRDLLQGNMTALVVGIDSLSGNLIIEGERNLNVNGDNHIMSVRGTVRPFDIMSDNTVLSYKLANANIIYKRDGSIRAAIKRPGALAGGAALLLVGAAIVFGSD